MSTAVLRQEDLAQRLAEAEATIAALLSGQIDAVVDPRSHTPVLLAKAQEALRRSEERYRRIVELANEGVWQIDAESKTTFMNQRMARMLGCEADMGVGRSPFEFLDEDERENLESHLQQPTTRQAEVCFTRLDGSSLWTLIEATPLFDDGGRYEGTLAMVMDISERRQAETALRASEARFRRLWESGIILISVSDMDGRIHEINDAGVRMLGYSRAELVEGRFGWGDITPAEWHGVDEAARAQLAATGLASPWEKEFLRKDGTRVPVLTAGAILDAAEGISIAIDMTDRKLAEAALGKTQQQYREIVEATTDGIVRVDASRVIVFVNGRFAEMLGYAPSEMVGRSAFDFMGPTAREQAAKAFDKHARGQADTHDGTFRHKDGTDIAVHVAGSPLFDAQGRYAGALGMVRNMTDRMKLQAQLMVSDRMASIGTLAAGVAHEINNPLTAVLGNLDYIAESLRPTAWSDASWSPAANAAWLRQEVRGPLEDAREAAERVRFIVRDLKMFARSPTEETQHLDVKGIMESSLRMAWNEIRHRAQLVKDYGVVPAVAVNEARLGQVFLNLIMNAAQAIPEGRAENNTIRVGTRLVGERVVIEVSDTGGGIPPENIGRIFDAFYTTKAVGVGTGLGLAICERIVTDMGGELTVESTLGAGTTFRVALPVAGEEPDEKAAVVERIPVAGLRGRILVVDDEEAVLRTVKRALSNEHDVVTVVSATKALALCEGGEAFDLILSDLMMPDMTGMDLFHALERSAPGQADRMIFLTGGAFTPNARSFLSASHKERIEKPFDFANLRAIIQRHLRQRS